MLAYSGSLLPLSANTRVGGAELGFQKFLFFNQIVAMLINLEWYLLFGQQPLTLLTAVHSFHSLTFTLLEHHGAVTPLH